MIKGADSEAVGPDADCSTSSVSLGAIQAFLSLFFSFSWTAAAFTRKKVQ